MNNTTYCSGEAPSEGTKRRNPAAVLAVHPEHTPKVLLSNGVWQEMSNKGGQE